MKRTYASPRTPSRAFGRRIWFLAALILVFAWADAARAAVSITDDTGRVITLERPATRVIALYGALNEILAGIGRGNVIVARTKADVAPASLARLPSIGTHMRPNIEAVLAQRPDLVLQMAGRSEAELPVAALRAQGVRVAVFRAANFEELFGVIRRVGRLTGADARAAAMVRGMKARLAALAAAAAKAKTRPRVFFEVRSPNMLAAGNGGIVGDIIRRAGGVNCIRSAGKFAHTSEEEIVRLAPDAYLIQRGPMNPAPLPLSARPGLRTIPAAENGRAWFVDERKYSRPGPQSVNAAEELFGLLHPKLRIPAGAGQRGGNRK